MTGRMQDVLLAPDTHANLPTATTVAAGALYPCTTHGKVYRNSGSAWVDWATVGGSSGAVLLSTVTTKGDLITATGSGAVTRRPVGSNGQVMTADSAETDGVKWATPAGGGGGAWTKNRRTAGNISVTATAWADLPSMSDITLAAQAGDIIEVALSGLWDDLAQFGFMDVATIVSSAVVNRFGGSSSQGIGGWVGVSGHFTPLTGLQTYTVQSGDISGGNVALRLRSFVTGGTKTIFAGSVYPLDFMARNTTR